MIKSFIAFKVPNLIESSHSLDSLRLEFNWFQKKKRLDAFALFPCFCNVYYIKMKDYLVIVVSFLSEN